MEWHQWVVLLLGVPAIGMTQVERLRPYACFPGLGGQLGWFAGIQPNQGAFFVASVLCCLIWFYSLGKHWLWPMWSAIGALDSATTQWGSGSIGPAHPKPTKPRLRVVASKD